MSIVITSPVTGAAQAGLTSPTYTLVSDIAPDINGRQQAVSALGGTQTGVLANTVSQPFTISSFRPKTFKVLGKPNPITGLISSVPKNQYKIITRKGVIVQVGQPAQVMNITTTCDVPAGSDIADPLSIKAALSLHAGAITQVASGIGDTLVQGIM